MNCGKKAERGKLGSAYSSDSDEEGRALPCNPAEAKLEKECCTLQNKAAGMRMTADHLVQQAKVEAQKGRPAEQKRLLKMSIDQRNKAASFDTRAATIKGRLDSAASALSQASVASKLMKYDMQVKDKVAKVAGTYNKLDHDALQDAVTDVDDLEESITMGPGWKTELDVDAVEDEDASLEAMMAEQNSEIAMAMEDLPRATQPSSMDPPGTAGEWTNSSSGPSAKDSRLSRMLNP